MGSARDAPAGPRGTPAALRLATLAAALAALLLVVAPGLAAAPPPAVHVEVFAKTSLKLTGVIWTGSHFYVVDNTTNRVYFADASGKLGDLLVTMPKIVEETRCVQSPGVHGFVPGDLYCHSPDEKIYRISPDGRATVIATLPETGRDDGALAYDSVGTFGYRLVAATGTSSGPSGGTVYTVSAEGAVNRVAAYPGPGGADNLAIAPAGFGTAAGAAFLTVDNGNGDGTIVAVTAKGVVRRIAHLPDGPNPIAVIEPPAAQPAPAPAGLYVSDTISGNVFLVRAAQLAPYAGDLIVGTEIEGTFWIVKPRGAGYRTFRVPSDLSAADLNLEGAAYVP